MNSSSASVSSTASTVQVTNRNLPTSTNGVRVMNETMEGPTTEGSLDNDEIELNDASLTYSALTATDSQASTVLSTLESTNSRFLIWIRGADGADGTDGANGADGADGADGANGANGADGAYGAVIGMTFVAFMAYMAVISATISARHSIGARADGAGGTGPVVAGGTGPVVADGANAVNGADGANGANGTVIGMTLMAFMAFMAFMAVILVMLLKGL